MNNNSGYNRQGDRSPAQTYRNNGNGSGNRNSNAAPVRIPTFTVTEVIPLTNTGFLVAFASVRVGPLLIHKFRLIRSQYGTYYVSAPQESWKDVATGATKYKALIDIPPAWRDALNQTVLAAYEAEINEL